MSGEVIEVLKALLIFDIINIVYLKYPSKIRLTKIPNPRVHLPEAGRDVFDVCLVNNMLTE